MRIGVFDSGVGGLTVVREMLRKLPKVDMLYLGDTARLPYGTKSRDTVIRYAVAASLHLVNQGVDLVVIACNTASSYALDEVSRLLDVPVVGVVEPGARAATQTGASKIGVIGTRATVRSKAYVKAIKKLAPKTEVMQVPTPLLVPLAEEGWVDHPITVEVARIYLDPLIRWGAEVVILGCTHYPLVKPALEKAAAGALRFVDNAAAVAHDVAEKVGEDASGDGHLVLQLTDTSENFVAVAKAILGDRMSEPELVHVDGSSWRGHYEK